MTLPSKDLLPRENPYGRPGFVETLAAEGLDRWSTLTARSLGEIVTDHRTSWVRRVTIDGKTFFVKTYDYPSSADRRRGWLRTTWGRPSRARREAYAAAWLRAHGFGAPEPLVAAEIRQLWVLRRAVLVTAAAAGRRLDVAAAELTRSRAVDLARQVRTEVLRLHRLGFRHRNLDPRNVIVDESDECWRIAFIDAPRYRLRRPTAAGRAQPADRAAREDWRRLMHGLAPCLGLDAVQLTVLLDA